MRLLAVETATAALLVAIASAMVSLTGLIWQLALYTLSGSRLDVRLIPAVLTAHGHILRGPDRGWRTDLTDELSTRLEDGYVDLAQIQVVNIGRTPVSVSDICLDFGRARLRPRSRHTISGRLVPVHGGAEDATSYRLEAGSTVTLLMDVVPLVEHERRTFPRSRSVRASARPAGRRPVRSPWRCRWKLSKGRKVGWPFSEPTADLYAFREVFRVVYPRDVTKLYDAWVEVGAARLGNPEATAHDNQEALEHALDVQPLAMDLMLTSHKIERLYRDAVPDPEAASA